MLKRSDTLVIGFDRSLMDETVLTVTKSDGLSLTYLNTFIGEEAVDLYNKLTNKSSKDNAQYFDKHLNKITLERGKK